MTAVVERHHWINTLVGLLDAAFYLTDEEQYHTIAIISAMLAELDIPARETPQTLPAAVALEVTSSFYTVSLSSPRDAGTDRPARPVTAHDMVASVESWREAFVSMLASSYRLEPLESVYVAGTLTDLLVALGVPDRAAAFFPDEVLRAFHQYG